MLALTLKCGGCGGTYHVKGLRLSLCVLELKKASKLVLASMLVLVNCYDNKMVKSPLIWVIYPLTQP